MELSRKEMQKAYGELPKQEEDVFNCDCEGCVREQKRIVYGEYIITCQDCGTKIIVPSNWMKYDIGCKVCGAEVKVSP